MALSAGSRAPDFALKDQHGRLVRLTDYRGARSVLVVFYPWAFSSICGGELDDVQQQLEEFQNDDVALVAISTDSMYALRTFADAKGYTFPLLSDFWPHGAVAAAYGVLHPEIGVATRGTFLVDEAGIVRWAVTNDIGAARSLDDYRRALAAL